METPPDSRSYPHEVVTFSDSRKFLFKCVMHNGETAIVIKKDSIEEMVIEDTAINWYSRGYIDLKNPRGSLENSIAEIEQNTRDTYVFRNDAKDFLFMYMIPNVFETEDELNQLQNAEDFQDDFYMLKHTFSIYSVKDITPTEDENNKIKRLYFTDWRHMTLSKLNSTFTTSMYLTGDTAHWIDDDRKIPSGDAIRNIIQDHIPGEQQFSPTWEPGMSMIDYTSPANTTVLHDLEQLVNMHVSNPQTGGQSCVLYLDRFTEQWSLVPLSTMFSRATTGRSTNGQDLPYIPGIWQTEHLIIGRDPDLDETLNLVENRKYRVPQTIGSSLFNYNFGIDSCIQNYRFVEMHGDKNQNILNTRPVHQYNITKKRFTINQTLNNAAYLSRHLSRDVFVGPPVAKKHQDTSPVSANVDEHRYLNMTIEHLYTASDEYHSMLSTGRNASVKQFLFQSNAIEFTLPGQTTRRSNRFISVSHNVSAPNDNKYNDKIEGQYMIAGVVHRLKDNMYTNKVIGLKPYNYDTVSQSDEDTRQLYAQDG